MKAITIKTNDRETAEEIREALYLGYDEHINCYYFDGTWYVELEGEEAEIQEMARFLEVDYSSQEMTYEIENI